MDFSWLQGLMYGLISGLTEFLPVSAETHRMLYLHLSGISPEPAVLRLCVRLFALLGMMLACRDILGRLRREQRLAAIPPRRRRRKPDPACMMELRLAKVAALASAAGLLFYSRFKLYTDVLWLHGAILVLNGILLYIPQFVLRGNKDARAMSSLDGVLIGIAAALSVFPGFSRMAAMVSVARIRGGDKRFGVELALLLYIPMLIVLSLLDFVELISVQSQLGFTVCAAASAAAMVGGFLGTKVIRYFGRKPGFTAFAYHSWGAALLMLILYLTII